MDNYETVVCLDKDKELFKREMLEEYFSELSKYESEIKRVKVNAFNELNDKYNKEIDKVTEGKYVQLRMDEIYDRNDDEIYLGALTAILGNDFMNSYYKEIASNDLSDLITILKILVSDDYIIQSKSKKDDYERQKLVLKNITLGMANKFTSNNIKNLYMLKNRGIGFNFTLYNRHKKKLLKNYIIELIKITEDIEVIKKLRIIVAVIEG